MRDRGAASGQAAQQTDIAREEPHYWSLDPLALAASLGTGPDGLTQAQARQRLARFGPNSLAERQRLGALGLLLRQFAGPLVLILASAAAISIALEQWIDASIILAMVIGSALLSFAQEYRASRAVAALQAQLSLTCRILRDGVEQEAPVSSVVPGDIVLLSAGHLVPADGVVMEARDFLLTEASITGESFPVEKHPGPVAPEAPVTGRTNCVFMGASVRSGTGRILIVRTGGQTAFGSISARLKARREETDFSRGVRQFGYLLIRVMVLIVLFVLTANILLGRPVIESLLFAAALAVGLSPELLPAIISVTLSSSARAMSKRGVLVRRLEAIENLGSMSVLCTDKTGTLTEGTIVLREAIDASGRESPDIRRMAYLNAAFETGIANPLDAAIVAAGEAAGLTIGGFRKIDEIPYDFMRRRLTIVVADDATPDNHVLITKGAVAGILDICDTYEREGANVPLDGAARSALETVSRIKGEQGFRVLALASRRVSAVRSYDRQHESGMVFRGFLVFFDPPRPEAAQTVRNLADLGLEIKVISGDNRHVTAHMAHAVGLNARSMLTGQELSDMSDEALWRLAPRIDLFVEIDPQQKERIVRALQRGGACVGYLGDGINDAPALQAADVGISVQGAVDVARESADIILTSRDLNVLRTGVEDGRRTFANTLKYISITTSANFGNMISMALATPFLPFLPLAAKQILLNNFLSDAPSIAISGDAVDPEQVQRPQRWNVVEIRRFMIFFGLTSSVFDLLTFGILLYVLQAGQAVFQTSWFMISLLSELAVVLLLRTRRPAWRSRPGRLLLVVTLAIAGCVFVIPFLGAFSAAFGFTDLSLVELAWVVIVVAAYLGATELLKAWYVRAAIGTNGSRQSPSQGS